MAELHLLRPLWLLAYIPVLLLWYQYRKKSDEKARLGKVIDPHLLDHLLIGQTEKRTMSPGTVFFMMMCIVILALSGPTFRQEPSPFAGDDAGLMVLMKLSASMAEKDVQPSRLGRAKQKLHDLLELRKGKSTGLVVYSGSSHLVMPPTTDGEVTTTMIEDLTPDLMPVEGDDLVGALGLGERMIEQWGNPGSLLIMADSVAPDQLGKLKEQVSNLPVQIHSFTPPGSAGDKGLIELAEFFRAKPVQVSLDTSDVELLARRSFSSLRQIAGRETGERWRDDGYWFLPFIGACFLPWFRKGWVVR